MFFYENKQLIFRGSVEDFRDAIKISMRHEHMSDWQKNISVSSRIKNNNEKTKNINNIGE